MVERAKAEEPEAQRRRSTRIVQTVPLTVTGVDALGQPFKERTSTLIINCHGCKYSSKHYVLKGSWVTLEVPHPEPGREPRTVRATVAWVQRPRSVRELFQIAVELEVPGNCWGIAFPPNDWFPFPEASAAELPAPGAEAIPAAQARQVARPEPEEKLRELPRAPEPPISSAVAPRPQAPAGVGVARPAPPARLEIAQLPAEIRQQIREAVRETSSAMVAAETDRLLRELSAQVQGVAEKAVQAAASSYADQMIRRALEKVEEARRASSAALREEWTGALESGLQRADEEIETRVGQLVEPLRGSFAKQLQEGLDQASAQFEELSRQVKELESAAGLHLAGAEARLGELRKEIESHVEAIRSNALGEAQILEEATAKSKADPLSSLGPSLAETEARLAALREETSAAAEAARASVQAQMHELQDVAERLRQETESGFQAKLAEAETQMRALGDSAEQLRKEAAGLIADSRAAWREKLESDMAFAGTEWNTMLESAVQSAAQRLAGQVDALSDAAVGRAEQGMTARAAEWIERAEGVAGGALERLRPALDAAESQFEERLALQADRVLGPQLGRAEEAARILERAQEATQEIVRTQREKLGKDAEEHVRATLDRLQQIRAQLQSDFEEAARALEAKWLAELDEKRTEIVHETFESLYKSSEWYQKKAHTGMHAALEKATEEAGHRLREQAAEVARLFSTELDHQSRSFAEHTQALLEEAAKETRDRVSAQLEEARAATASSFGDEAHKVAEQKLQQLAGTAEAAVSEIANKIDERLRQASGQADTLIERAIGELQQRFAQQLETDLAQARERGDREWRDAIALASNDSLEEYKRRLESASNACIAAAVATLHAHTQATLRSLTESTQAKVREVFGTAVSNVVDTVRDRLLNLSAEIYPATKPPEET